MHRILNMIGKEFRQVFRDRPMLAIIFVAPVVQLLILSFAITTEVKHIKLVVCDLDGSSGSRELVRRFANTDRFDVAGFTSDMAEIKEGMRAWRTQAALVIPPGFERDMRRNLRPQLEFVIDGTDGNAGGIAMSYAYQIFAGFGIDRLGGRGGGRPAAFSPPQAEAASTAFASSGQPTLVPATPAPAALASATALPALPVTAEERMWYNPDLGSRQFMVPGIVVVLLTILPMMLSAMSLVREKEIGTLEQLLVTPLRKHEILLGKLIPFLVLAYIELAIVTAVAVLVFKIPMNGSYLLLAFLASLYLFTTIGLGIFISTLTRSQQQAMFVAWFFMVFMIMMSGFFIPIENMPFVLQKLTYLNPMRYFMYIIRDVFQKGSSLGYLVKDVVPMTVFGLLILFFSVMKFQKRVG
ncbi:MAG: ABC transporter permease [Candidatus Eisenbacteria bacterium]